MSLYLKYRPGAFSEMYGNEEIVQTLETMVKDKESCPHAFLLHGPTGCGKTTLGRIIATELGCEGSDLSEIDSADFRGIDTIRDIRRNAQYKPMEGECRVFILDECFATGTLVNTPNGKIPIEQLKVNDSVFSLHGKDTIKNVFQNKVTLDRVMKLTFDNGISLICSIDHLFFTTKGWVKAKDLNKKTLILPFNSQFMFNANKQTYEKDKKMLNVRQQNSVLSEQTSKVQSKILQQQMCGEVQQFESERTSSFRGNKNNYFKEKKSLFNGNGGGCSNSENTINTYETKQPFIQFGNFGKSKRNKKNKWVTSHLERGTRWKWNFDRASKTFSDCFGLENGSCNQNIKSTKSPKLLQSGYWKRIAKDCNRSEWQRSFIETKYRERFEEKNNVGVIRLESSVFYQRSNNDQSFSGIIGNKERSQGFVTLYDIEVTNHPSYFVDGIAVHNCHKMTNDAQNALLKILEDTPKHVYFILCTTEPNRLIATIRGRCSQFQVKLLNDNQMYRLLRNIAKNEGAKVEKEVYEQIIQDSLGHPRNAIQTLDQVLRVDADKQMEMAKKAAAEQSESIELCRVLLTPSPSWKKIALILEGLKDQDAESIRRHVLGYCQAVLLKNENNQAALVLETFIEPLYNSGFPGLIFYCYSVTH